MQNTLNYIEKTKQQIKKTVDAVTDVKKSLNKQKSEKEGLSGNRSKRWFYFYLKDTYIKHYALIYIAGPMV